MPNLDEIEWNSLRHAYGTASDLPGLLHQLENYPQHADANSEPFVSLWSALCHQGDVYTASYAASPVILALAVEAPERISFDYLLLPTQIEISRVNGLGPEIPPALVEVYFGGLKRIPSIIGNIRASGLDETLALTCAAAIAVSGGHATIAEAILELEGGMAAEFLEWAKNR